MPETTLNVKLLGHTPEPERLTAMGARLCYSPAGIDEISEKMSDEKAASFIEKVIDIGHLSTIEHASFSFGIEGVSRTVLTQITRHRLASFSVQSQRYVSYRDGFSYIVPESIRALGSEAVEKYEQQMRTMQGWYEDWQTALGESGEKANQDARFVLPGACETKMILTMNARELNHFFSLRCCNRAQWEIRALAWEMLKLASNTAPALFKTAGPSCVRGKCAEGVKTCGKANEIKAKQSQIVKGNG